MWGLFEFDLAADTDQFGCQQGQSTLSYNE